jgi:hypothetical protein
MIWRKTGHGVSLWVSTQNRKLAAGKLAHARLWRKLTAHTRRAALSLNVSDVGCRNKITVSTTQNLAVCYLNGINRVVPGHHFPQLYPCSGFSQSD